MRAAAWLAWRELGQRRTRLLAAVAMVAVAVALCLMLELVERAREVAVAGQIDQIGPALRVIPAGATAAGLARLDLGNRVLDRQSLRPLRDRLDGSTRAVEGRLVVSGDVQGERRPVVGIDPGDVVSPFEELGQLGRTDVAFGAEIARVLGKRKGDPIVILGARLTVAAVLPTAGGIEDLATFMRIDRLRELARLPAALNELRFFPRPGVSMTGRIAALQGDHPDLRIVNADRGAVAEREAGASLRRHRWAVYLATALVMAVCLLIGAYLNARERQIEMATLLAVGGTPSTLLLALVLRAIFVGMIGAAVGYLIAAGATLAQDFASAIHVVGSWRLLLGTTVATIGIGLLATGPVALRIAYDDHVRALQQQ